MKRLLNKYASLSFHEKLNRFALSNTAFFILLLLSSLIVIFDFEINGVAVFGFIFIGMLLLCSDIRVLLLPLLLMSIFACECYDSAEKFLSFIIPEAVIIVLSLIIHFLLYSGRFTPGKSFLGLCGVSVAVTFSGVFSVSVNEYFSPTSLYYTFFLGIGMILIYLFVASLTADKKEVRADYFPIVFYLSGCFAAFCVFFHYIRDISDIIASAHIIDFQSANNLSTFLMICLPFTFYFSIKYSKLHIITSLFLYLALVLSGSGGGLLMGSILFFLCLIFAVIYDKKSRKIWLAFSSLGTIGGALIFIRLISEYNFASFDDIFYSNSTRMAFIRRSIVDFQDRPIFGVGLCYKGNTDIYTPVSGAMNWYHMMIPQIIGSMGIVGILGYLWNFIVRLRLSLSHRSLFSATLTMSYLGLFLMSQVNPGEFCPIPYALVGVILYMYIEKRKD